MASTAKERRLIGSLQRAFDILDLFSITTPELGITEIAQNLKLHKSTASGLIYTLEANGFLEQNPENRKYRLGLKVLELASTLLSQMDIRKLALPLLHELCNGLKESVNLAILDGHEVIYIERILSEQILGIRTVIGKRADVHSTALGKAMLACLPQEKAQQILNSYRLEPRTVHTMISVENLMKDLQLTQERGFALDDEENELGGRCVSAAILNHQGKPVAAISVSVPLPRIPREKISYYGTKVKEVAEQISTRLGYSFVKP